MKMLIVEVVDLVIMLKVVKNVVEIVGMCVVYLCDGVVMVELLVWLDVCVCDLDGVFLIEIGVV